MSSTKSNRSGSSSSIIMMSPSSTASSLSSVSSSFGSFSSSNGSSLGSLIEVIAASPPSLKVCRSPNSLRSYLSFCLQESSDESNDEGEGDGEDSEWDELSEDDEHQWTMGCDDLKPVNTFEFFSSAISISSVSVSAAPVPASTVAFESPNVLDVDTNFLCSDDDEEAEKKAEGKEEDNMDHFYAKLKSKVDQANRRWDKVKIAVASELKNEDEEEEMIFSLELSSDPQQEVLKQQKPKQKLQKETAVVRFNLEDTEEFWVPKKDECRSQHWFLVAFDRWRTGQTISRILATEHRERIYQERFAENFDNGDDHNRI